MSFRVAFKERGNAGRYIQSPPQVKLVPISWTSSAIGGPSLASIDMIGSRIDMEAALPLVGHRVEIFSPTGEIVWWGLIQSATFENGNISTGVSLDTMWNRIRVAYTSTADDGTITRGDTAWARDDQSVAIYGTKEYQVSTDDMSLATANAYRDDLLSRLSLPRETSKVGVYGYGVGRIECIGIWDTLAWRYFQNLLTGDVETSAQIEFVASSENLNIAGVTVSSLSGIFSQQFRDGDATVRFVLGNLMASGVASGERYICHVDRYDHLWVYEQPAQPSASPIQIQLDGSLNLANGRWPQGKLPVGHWADLKTHRSSGNNGYFVEQASYDAQSDTYRIEQYNDDPFDVGLVQG